MGYFSQSGRKLAAPALALAVAATGFNGCAAFREGAGFAGSEIGDKRTDVYAITPDMFEDVVLKSNKPVLVAISRKSCSPCAPFDSVLTNLARQARKQIRVVTMDFDAIVEDLRDVSSREEAMEKPLYVFMRQNYRDTLPATILMNEGETVRSHWGARKGRELRMWIERGLGTKIFPEAERRHISPVL